MEIAERLHRSRDQIGRLLPICHIVIADNRLSACRDDLIGDLTGGSLIRSFTMHVTTTIIDNH